METQLSQCGARWIEAFSITQSMASNYSNMMLLDCFLIKSSIRHYVKPSAFLCSSGIKATSLFRLRTHCTTTDGSILDLGNLSSPFRKKLHLLLLQTSRLIGTVICLEQIQHTLMIPALYVIYTTYGAYFRCDKDACVIIQRCWIRRDPRIIRLPFQDLRSLLRVQHRQIHVEVQSYLSPCWKALFGSVWWRPNGEHGTSSSTQSSIVVGSGNRKGDCQQTAIHILNSQRSFRKTSLYLELM